MRRDFRKNKTFNRRTFFLGGIQTSLTALIVARLGFLQIVKHDEYNTRSDNNRIKPLITPAPRGLIMDRNGVVLAKNEQNYRLLLYLENRKNVGKTIDKIVQILELNEDAIKLIHKRLENTRRKTIISLIDNLSWNDLARIEANSYKLSGVSIASGTIRNYPFPYETAHCIGFVSLPSEQEINSENQSLFLHPDFRIGKNGIEKTFDEYLRGRYGVKSVEVNAFGVPVRTLSIKEPVEGSRLDMTIDFRLQQFVTDRIKNDVASVTVLDIKTGEIYALASSPSFDQNNFVEGITREYWQELMNDPRKPMSNKFISATYPPGSTFKLIVAIAGLEAGINPMNKVYCPGYYQLGRRRFHCWKKEGHGALTMSDGIKHSCNTYFFTIANNIGIDRIAETARRFGYGELFDINLYGTKSGNIPDEAWKKKIFKQPWVGGDTLNTAIGQGFVLATPLQLAVIAARIANGAVPIKPYLIKNPEAVAQYQKLQNKTLASASHIALVQEGMIRVINEAGGTAYWRRIIEPEFAMAGKTGTSQVISKRESEMSSEEMRRNQNHAIFIGYAPISNPKYAISVVVEHGGSGSEKAAPIGHDVLLEAQKLGVV